MSELVKGGSYAARRNGQIVVQESDKGAMMVYIPYALVGDLVFEGTQKVCIAQKDGTPMTLAIENLHTVFPEWKTTWPYDLQRLEMPESKDAQFMLKDWANEPWTNSKGETVDSWNFKWINPLGSGVIPATAEQEEAAKIKWGAKFGLTVSTEKKTAPAAHDKTAKKPTRKIPAKKTSEPRKMTAELFSELLIKKHYPDVNATEAQQETLFNEHFYPASDEVLGKGKYPETEEEWGRVATHLGL